MVTTGPWSVGVVIDEEVVQPGLDTVEPDVEPVLGLL
jgi:hypothetical protein